MSAYSRLCALSSAVSLGTVGLLLWTANGREREEAGYIYFSLAAPTLALSHHVLYFFGPFSTSTSTGTTKYTFISTSISSDDDSENTSDGVGIGVGVGAATPATSSTPTSISTLTALVRSRLPRLWGRSVQTQIIKREYVTISDEATNPMISSTLSIIFLIFLSVLVGAFAVSAGAVAFLDALDSIAAEKNAERLAALSDVVLPAGANATDPITNGTMVAHTGLDHTVPPTPILAFQASLSLFQAMLLGSLALAGVRIRALYSSQDDMETDVEWVYEEEDAEENK